ncbi:MAG: hypothetical protein ABL962_08435 [Fimbriimonadaceae bacterium]
MLKAYWLRLLLFAGAGAALALIASQLVDPKYEAVVELLIDQKAVMPNIAVSSADQSVTDLLDFSRARSLTTTVQQLTSLGTIQEACEKVATNRVLKTPQFGDNGDLDPIIISNSITVQAEATSDIVSLRVRHKKKDFAQSIAQEIYQAIVAQNQRSATSLAQQAIASLKGQANDVQTQLDALDKKVVSLQEAAGAPDVAALIQSEVQQMTTLKSQHDNTMADVQSLEQRVAEYEAGLKEAAKRDGSVTTSPNPLYQRLTQDIAAANIEYDTFRTRYTDDREEVRASRNKLAHLKAQLKTTEPTVPQTAEGTNPLTNQFRQNLTESKSALEGSRARVTELSRQISEKEAVLKALPAVQSNLRELQRQRESTERVSLALNEKLKSLEAAKIGRISVIKQQTAAQALPDPVSPKKLINAIFGVIAGLIFGVLSMLATEAKRQPVRSLSQLNALALKPVYRLVPELRQPYRGLSKAPAEAFDSLLTNYLRSSNRPYRVAVVGIVKDSGASTAAINLAIAGSRHGARVLLVQCDPRGGISRLSGQQPPAEGDVAEISPLIKAVTADSILSLSGERNPEIMAGLKQHEADLTIIDLEPTTRSAEYAFLAPHVDEVILLVRAGRSKSVEFLQAQQALKEAGCKHVTVALTRSSDLAVVTEAVETETDAPSAQAPKSLEE